MQGRRADPSRRDASQLPRIAPRYDATSPDSRYSRGNSALASSIQNAPRTRLPPRSRSGCWTCRTRKVKCDEQRPTCGQCARLGHDCDYNPRLAFRDDTARVKERVQDVTTSGYSVWSPNLPKLRYGPTGSGEDLLPVFTALMNDEDREKKAALHAPGTFVVVANPKSFASLPEYCDNESPVPFTIPTPASSSARSHDRANKRARIHKQLEELNDPNTTILEAFEDPLRRPVSPITRLGFFSAMAHSAPYETHIATTPQPSEGGVTLSKLDEARNGGRNAHLLQHYRSHISPHVIKIGLQDIEEDVFETQARTFPPLFHAMMAISALSMAHRAGTQNAEALEHYQQVLPAIRGSLQSGEVSHSDGVLFTHYLLLLYEIASAGPWESNMWQTHCRTLGKIVGRRRDMNHTEPHGYLVWVICLVDMYALLSGSGNGDFVQFVLKNNMLLPQDILPPLAPGQSQAFFREEFSYFPTVLDLTQQVVRLAVRVGETARNLRGEIARISFDSARALESESKYIVGRQIRVREIQVLCQSRRAIWEATYPQYWSLEPCARTLPYRVRNFCDHFSTLYRVCVIYSYTSMYPGQMAEAMADSNIKSEVQVQATEIIKLAQQVVTEQRWELQYMPFSLFLAGVVSKRKEEKALALDLMTAMERQSCGENTATMRRLLKAILDKQQANSRNGNPHMEVDWIEEMRSTGFRLVMFGV